MKKILVLLLLAGLLVSCVDDGNDNDGGGDGSYGDTYWGVIEDISIGGYIGEEATIAVALIALYGLIRLELFLQKK